MPSTCPHCGFRLPMVVDAFCPECREDLGDLPAQAAGGPNLHRPADVPLEAVICWIGVVLIGVGGFLAAFGREWEAVLVAAVMAGLLAAVAIRVGRPPTSRTSVTGREKTRPGAG